LHLILENLLKSFRSKYEIDSSVSSTKAFEYFANHLIASRHSLAKIDPVDLTTDEDDAGIDGIQVFIDGEPITSIEELNGIFARPKREFEAELIFIQAKTSEKFEKKQITNFSDGVYDFFSELPNLPHGEFLKERRILIFELLNNAARLKNGRPTLNCIFVGAGIYNSEAELKAAFKVGVEKLSQRGYFSLVEFSPVDRDQLIKLEASSRAEVVAQLPVLGFAPYPSVDGIKQAYVAVVKAKDLVNQLLKNSDGKLRSFIFEENVRDFLGATPANSQMNETLSHNDKRKRFGILNNGITVISKDISYGGNTFTLKDFQIVNGCQTSNVLFEQLDSLDDSVVVTTKLVEASDSDIVSDIIRATNSQSKVDDSNFVSIQPISRRLERYFDAQRDSGKWDAPLYLERRQGQFRAQDLIQSRVFPLRDVYRASAAFWFDRPDLAGRYTNEIYKELPILLEERSREIVYFTATLALYKFSLLTAGGRKMSKDLAKARWHLLMCIKYFVTDSLTVPNVNHKSADDYCEKILSALKEDNGYAIFTKAANTIVSLGDYSRDRIRTKVYIEQLKKAVEAQRTQLVV
jgi:hypothetical protein